MKPELSEIYYKPSNPASFGGPSRLHKESSVSIKKAEQFLQAQDTYTKNKNVRHKFKRRKIIVPHSMYLWQADLIILSNIGKINRGYKYILTVIDCFSRKAAAVPLKRKTGKDVTFAFAKVFAEMGGKPKYLQCDQGKEFFNMEFKSFLSEHGVQLYHNFSDKKAAIVERFNRTLMMRLQKIFEHQKKRVYFNILPEVLSSYNKTYHTSIQNTPNHVSSENKFDTWLVIYKNLFTRDWPEKSKLQKNDIVRIKRLKQTFEKGYAQNFSNKLFKIVNVHSTKPFTYSLLDPTKNELIDGIFYDAELSKVKY